jgi:hypothetical protein
MGVLMEAGGEYALVPRFTCQAGLYSYCETLECPTLPVSGPGADYIAAVYYYSSANTEPYLEDASFDSVVYRVKLEASPRWVGGGQSARSCLAEGARRAPAVECALATK